MLRSQSDLVRIFDDGTISFERRTPPPSPLDQVVRVEFAVLALDTPAFVRLSASTYARAAKAASTSTAASYTVELALELPEDRRPAVAFFQSPESFVRPIEFMRTARTKKPRILTSCLVSVAAAERRNVVEYALVDLLAGVADEFDLESTELSSGAKVLRLDENALWGLVAHTLK